MNIYAKGSEVGKRTEISVPGPWAAPAQIYQETIWQKEMFVLIV